jgi:hypothetical protein
MKNKELLVGIIVFLVIAECFVILGYSTSDGGQTGNSSLVKNGTGHATPLATLTKSAATATTKGIPATATKTSTLAPVNTTRMPTTMSTPIVYTSNQINQHFIDIAFNPSNPKISKISASTEKIAITGSYNDQDKAVLSNFIQQFNAHSSTLTLPGSPTDGTQGDIVINFMSGSALESLSKDTSYNSVNSQPIYNMDDSGTICSVYRTTAYGSTVANYIYLNADLTGNAREHYIIRGVLYFMGFPGESGRYPTSIFYSQPGNTVVTLNPIDLKAVEIMYGSTITNGMTMSAAKSLFPT